MTSAVLLSVKITILLLLRLTNPQIHLPLKKDSGGDRMREGRVEEKRVIGEK